MVAVAIAFAHHRRRGVARRHATAITAAMLAAQHLRLTTATERLTTAEVAVGCYLTLPFTDLENWDWIKISTES